jgi:CRISP-associated protein Cas1
MTKEAIYLTMPGCFSRKQNTTWFESSVLSKAFPVNNTDSIYCLSEISINSKILVLLARKGIAVHFFSYYGAYAGSFLPKNNNPNGSLLVKQVQHYEDSPKRLYLARCFVTSISKNLLRVLEHYRKHGKGVKESMDYIKNQQKKIDKAASIPSLMQIEGSIWNAFYHSYDIVVKKFRFDKRTIRPPENEINCLLSFLNSLLYAVTLNQVYQTQLDPSVSFLHEPLERRFSLVLDISEMFKPVLVQKTLLALVNLGLITSIHFRKENKACLLNEEGKKIVLKEFDSALKKTVFHPELNRSVSYKSLIRMECFKLIAYLKGNSTYQPFIIWW